MVLFGIRSPIVVEYEESCHRSGRPLTCGISVSGAPRSSSGLAVIDLDAYVPADSEEALCCAFSPERRRELALQARAMGLLLAEALVDPHAVVSSSARIGAGSFVNAGCVIGSVTRIGEGVLVNRSASVGHHCLIGDYVSIGPGATLAGNIRVDEGAVIGAGCVVQPGLRIGAGAIVAAGSVVRAHVPEGTLVAGNPARQKPFRPKLSSLFHEGSE